MNFKKIEVFGFKSFADRKKIEINDGITGIVGPNGCGKSNVADAVRWVLGEQSAKALRGKSMQDVIFNGTKMRKSMSFAEVSLYFDNKDKLFPTLAFDEVKITRKLFRSGESEYYINDTQCRLRDIQEIIRNTGLGKEGYSIIGQGRVSEIINAKPVDRRAIFEDAAGISTHKKRKKEAQSKLEQTENNLQRIESVLQELDRQLEPLERQSADARKFLQLRDELRDLEINEFVYGYEHNADQKAQVQAELDSISAQLESLTTEQEEADKKYSRMTMDRNNTDVYISRLRDELTELAVAAESKRGEGNTLSERMAHLTSNRKEAESRLVTIEDEIESKDQQHTYHVSQLNMAKEEKAEVQAEHDELDKEYEELLAKLTEGEREMESRNDELLKAMASIADIKENYGKLTAERDTLTEREDELSDEMTDIKGELKQAEESRLALESNVQKLTKQRDRLASSRNEIMFSLREANAKAEKYRTAAVDIQANLSGLESRIKLLADYSRDYSNFRDSVKRLMMAAKHNDELASHIEGVVADIIKVPAKYETAMTVALGGSVQNVVTENEEDAKYLIRYLKTNGLASVTFLPLTSYKRRDLDARYAGILREKGCLGEASKLVSFDKKYDSIVSGLLGSTVVFDNMDDAIAAARRYSYGVRIVTLEGEMLNTTGAISGGSMNRSAMANVFGHERTLQEYRDNAEKLKREHEKAVSAYKAAQEEADELQEQLKVFDEDFHNAEVDLATATQKLEKAAGKCDELSASLTAKTQARENIRSRISLINSALESVDTGKEMPEHDDAAEKERRAGYAKMRERSKQLSAQLTELRVELNNLENAVNTHSEAITRLEGEIAALKEEHSAIRRALSDTEDKIKQTESDIDNAVVSAEDRKRQTEIKDKISKLDEYKAKLDEDIAALLVHKDGLTKSLISANEEKVRQEAKMQKIDEDAEEMRVHIAEEYELDYAGAVRFRRADFDHEKAVGEITKLRRAMSKLGPVSLESIDMYKEVQGRHDELAAQRDDMRKAQSDILEIIATLSKEMSERFDREFKKINSNFQTIFSEMFGGGTGRLEVDLDSAEDPLEAGIEIYAEPPGKNLRNLSQLSGGEQAFTAICILFAILRLRPMPFCILDEIDAALDESNVDLFARYLKRFSDSTQFIVITHRKPTMEQADMLYGVTMQELGVSDVVSVSLKEAVKHSSSE